MKVKVDVDREYVEIYPIVWKPLDALSVRGILTQQSEACAAALCLYVHVPFCPVSCPYCGFNKRLFRADLYQKYLKALHSEIQLYSGHPDAAERHVPAIYFGGGTGSMLDPKHVREILARMHDNFKILPTAQITMECYPTTINKRKLASYREAGINRISIGIQTFGAEFLELVHRSDSVLEVEQLCQSTREVGFDNLRVDLMYRLPGQTLDSLKVDLDRFVSLNPDGISTYSLELGGLPFERVAPDLPDNAADREMFYFIGDFLAQFGYLRFTQPDFAKPGCEDAYVLNAWAAPQGLLLGFGPGAQTHHFGGYVFANIWSVERYAAALGSGRFPGTVGAKLHLEDLMHKYMVLGVRCLHIDTEQFRRLFGVSLRSVFESGISEGIERGWLIENDGSLDVTTEGLWYIDNISKLFFSADNRGQTQPRGQKLFRYKEMPEISRRRNV